jgi:hypothetical protein
MLVAATGGGERMWRRRNQTDERDMASPAGKEYLAEVDGTPPEPVELKEVNFVAQASSLFPSYMM